MQEGKLFDIGLGDKKVEISPEVEKAYEGFLLSYDKVAEAIEDQVEKVYSNGLEAAIELNLSSYYDDYRDHYEIYFFALSDWLFGKKFDILSFPSSNIDIYKFFYNARKLVRLDDFQYSTNFLMIQRVGIIKEVAEFLYQIYQAQVNPNLPVFKYMEMGATHLGYTRDKMYNRMNGAIRQKNETKFVSSLLKALLGKRERETYGRCGFDNIGAAMADYSYTFFPKYKKQVKINHVPNVSGLLSQSYKNSNCGIDLGMGLRGALFAVPEFDDAVILSFAGTEKALSNRKLHNVVTDIFQLYYGPETTYMAAVGLLKDIMASVKDDIWVVGHSLGGGLMQYACVAMNDSRVHGIGYNAAGLSSYSLKALTANRINMMEHNIRQIRSCSDYISRMGKLIGKDVQFVDTNKNCSHSLDDLILAMNGELISCYC